MKKLSLLIWMALISSSLLAQHRGGKPGYDREKLEAAKIAFITQKLDITPDQAEEFWPIYNEFEEKRRNIHHQMRKTSQVEKSSLTNEKATELINSKIALQEELLNLEKKSIEKFSETLSPKQVFLLQEADREFVKQLFRMNRQRGNRPKKEAPIP
ncbi:Spy/CpxP family protein refolding chaperone [Echinicola rosea]|nr:Spy/CpxP family protein refolding chaperone [Echinicola rosea]